MQVLVASLPVGLTSVNCDGTEMSLLECSVSEDDLKECGIDGTNLTKATVLACGNTGPSAPPFKQRDACCPIYGHEYISRKTLCKRRLPVQSFCIRRFTSPSLSHPGHLYGEDCWSPTDGRTSCRRSAIRHANAVPPPPCICQLQLFTVGCFWNKHHWEDARPATRAAHN